MPSLSAIEPAQQALGIPVTSTAACTARQMLHRLGLQAKAPGAGAYLGSQTGLR
jgi:maleate isomerase